MDTKHAVSIITLLLDLAAVDPRNVLEDHTKLGTLTH